MAWENGEVMEHFGQELAYNFVALLSMISLIIGLEDC